LLKKLVVGMKKIIREPLFHFLIIGCGLFLLYSVVNKRDGNNEIVIDQDIIDDLSAKWNMQWYREPNLVELKRLITLYINQEVLYREALAMNLDHNDEIIKRRLAKKMEFISDDLAESLQPSENILRAYYISNKKNYAKPPIYTFKQVFFKNQVAADSALEKSNPVPFGDPLSLPGSYSKTDALKVSIDFGRAFAESLDTLEMGNWTGPVKSGFGSHLVFIEEKQLAGYYSYDDVAHKVNLDYNYQASNDFQKELITTLLKDYEISFVLSDTKLKEALVENF
jgi:hypothetical protein